MAGRLAPFLAIVLAVIVANGLSLTLTDPDPVLQRSGLPLTQGTGLHLIGLNSIDPNDGYTTQSLGIASLRSILHGELPLWNHNEGIGQPLLAGMQGASLFPFSLLLMLPEGVLVFHMVLEVVAGIGMLLLLRKLGLPTIVTVAGGILFALNGTFAWIGNAIFNPIAFAPWLLLAVEIARDSSSWRALRGWWLAGAAVALSLLAGFPEVAYLDAVPAALWALVRLPGTPYKIKYLTSLALGVVLGALIAAPALVAFAEYLPNAWVGGHSGSGSYNYITIPAVSGVLLVLPYIWGTIFGSSGYDPSGTIATTWGNVGGYLTMGTAALGALGVFAGRRTRGLQILLAAWVLLCIGRIYGLPVISDVLTFLPGSRTIAQQRYLNGSMSTAAIVLAALGVDALLRGRLRPVLRRVLGVVIAVAAIGWVAAGILTAKHFAAGAPNLRLLVGGSAVLALVVVAAIALTAFGVRWAKFGVIPLVVAEAVILFLVPQASAPARPASIDTAPVTYLQKHLGLQRYFSLGVILPNYGSYFGIASLNDNNLPVPATWGEYISTRLDQQALPDRFDGRWAPGGDPEAAEAEFYENLASYESAGVKYVVAPKDRITAAEAAHAELTRVFRDARTEIWRLADPDAYFSAPGCSVQSKDRDRATVSCAQNSTLVRRELSYPGWQVTVDGKRTGLGTRGVFQTVKIAAGEHTVEYDFRPAYTTSSFIIGAAALLLLLGGALGQSAIGRSRRADGTAVHEPTPNSLTL